MAKCRRCGGGKTITMTTTGTHVLPCPTCAGSGEFVLAGEDGKNNVSNLLHPEVEALATPTPCAADLIRTGSSVA
jgi:hypothetical protein